MIPLRVADVSASVTVIAEAPLIHAANGDVSSTMNEVQISLSGSEPGQRSYLYCSNFSRHDHEYGYGAREFRGFVVFAGNFSNLGMPGTSNLFTFNGMNDNDNGSNLNYSGAMNMLLGQNQIQDAIVVTEGYSGHFGGAAGANVNYITKSLAGMTFGNAVYFWNGTLLNANDWMLGAPRRAQFIS